MVARNLAFTGLLYLYAGKYLLMTRISAWLLLFTLLTVSCLDEPDCFQLNNYRVGIAFRKLIDSSADTVAFNVIATVEPPVQFTGQTSLSKLTLPLNYFENETTFLFESPDTVRYLRLGYVSQAQFVSEDCGEKFVLSKLRVLETTFDSVRLVTDVPTSEGAAINLEIFQ